jgi:DNA (cytosine-5)-methyltransferase 1
VVSAGLTAVSLFAGIGGIDLALQRAGVNVVAAVEIDPDCRGVFARHFPDCHLFSDVTEVTGDQLLAAGFVPGRGILAGGWPCTGNSVAGHRLGLDDPRSGLWRHFVRLVAETRPAWFFGENVPGLYSVNGGRDIAVVRRDLAQLGYWWAERILDAQFTGVPQRRRRVFFVGCPGNGAAPVEVLLEPEGGEGNPAARGEARPGAAGSTSGGAGGAGTVGTIGTSGPGGGWRVGADEAAAGQLITAYTVHAAESCAKERHAFETTTTRCLDTTGGFASSQGGTLIAATVQGGGKRGHRIDAEGAAGGHLIAHALTAREGKGPDSDATNGFILAPAIPVAWRGRGMEAGEPEVANALRSAGDGHIGDQMGYVMASTAIRRLTPTECERLQGLPDEWTRWKADGTEQSDSARYRQCGNSVAVPCVEWIARRLVVADLAQALGAGEAA